MPRNFTTLIAPEGVTEVTHEGVRYTVEDGTIDVQNEGHIAWLKSAGFHDGGADSDDTMLYGSSVFGSSVDVGQAEPVQLGEVVRHAHSRSELTATAWNNLTEVVRDRLLTLSVIEMRNEAALADPDSPNFEAMTREGLVAYLVALGVTDHKAIESKASLISAAQAAHEAKAQ